MSKYSTPPGAVNGLQTYCVNQDLLTLQGEFARSGLALVGPDKGQFKAQCIDCIGGPEPCTDTNVIINVDTQTFICQRCGASGGLREFADALDCRKLPPQNSTTSIASDQVSLSKDDHARTEMEVLWGAAAPMRGPMFREVTVDMGPERWLAEDTCTKIRWFAGSNEGLVTYPPMVLARWLNIIDGSWTGTQAIYVDDAGLPTGKQRTIGEYLGSAVKLGPPLPTGNLAGPLCVAPSLRAAALAGRVLAGPMPVWVLPSLREVANFPVLRNVSHLTVVVRSEDKPRYADKVAQRYLRECIPVETIQIALESGEAVR